MAKSRKTNATTTLVLDENGNRLNMNAQQLLFANYLIETRNATKAGRMAGYSTNTIPQLLKNPEIISYVKSHSEYILDRCNIRQETIVRELARVGFSNVFDYFEEDYSIKDPSNIPRNAQKAVQSLKIKVTRTIKGDSVEEVKEIDFKLYDKIKALLSLAEMAGLVKKEEPVNNVTVNNTYIEQLDKYYVDNVKKEG